MNLDAVFQIMIVLLLIGVNAYFVASEIAIVSIRQARLMQLIEEGNKSAKILERFISEPSRLLATVQIGVTLSGFFTSAFGAQTLSVGLADFLKDLNIPVVSSSAEIFAIVLITLILSYFTLVLGELVPKRLALAQSEQIALKVAKPINILAKITYPIVKLLSISTNSIVRLMGASDKVKGEDITEEEIRLMINVGQEKGIFRKTETNMIHRIFEFDDTEAREVMTPRMDMTAVRSDIDITALLNIIEAEGFSRIPVYDESIDNIIGVLYVKDLFSKISFGKELDINLKDMIRSAYFVSEYIKIDDLFKQMQKSKNHIAIVIDEYGGTAGLITIEDLLEEIVGNIFDEYDDVEQDYQKINDNIYIISGKLSLSDVNDYLNIKLPDEEYDTISGLVLSLTGAMPKTGEQVAYENLMFKIVEIDRKRISKIKITILP